MLTQFSGAAEKFYWLNFPICVFAAYEKETKTGLQKKPNFKIHEVEIRSGMLCADNFSPEHDPCKKHEPTTKQRYGERE